MRCVTCTAAQFTDRTLGFAHPHTRVPLCVARRIGLKDITSSSDFNWEDGASEAFTAWDTAEPVGAAEPCGAINVHGVCLGWLGSASPAATDAD